MGPVRRTIGAVRDSSFEPPEGELRILVACSGGADSVALLGLLCLLQHGERLDLVVGHVDHGLREASAAEARSVAALAKTLGLAAMCCRLNLAYGPQMAERARHARRRSLIEQAVASRANVIALGHTASDQAETILLRMARGTGIKGLGGMRPVCQAALGSDMDAGVIACRPLLTMSRAEARAICGRLGLPFIDDPTNADLASPRVRIRTCVLPQLETLHGGATHALADLARFAHEDEDALASWCAREWVARRRPPARGETVVVDMAGYAELPIAVRRRLLRRAFVEGGLEPSALRRRTLAAIDRRACSRTGCAQFDLRPECRLVLDADLLRVERHPIHNH